MYVCMYVCMYIYVHIHICMYVCMYVYMYTCIYVCVRNNCDVITSRYYPLLGARSHVDRKCLSVSGLLLMAVMHKGIRRELLLSPSHVQGGDLLMLYR